MEKSKRRLGRNRWFWIAVFTVLFALSIDFWWWSSDVLLFESIPLWVIRIMILQIGLSITIALFVKYYWREER